MEMLLKIVLSICICVSVSSVISSLEQDRKIYIAYMGSLPTEGEYSASLHHSQIITQIVDPSYANKSLVRSYTRSFNGFAAYLSEEEKEKLIRTAGVVSVFPCQKSQLQTTRSWDFMGLTTTVERRPAIESDIIVGVIDTGIWPELPSFSDEGFGPIPTKWKGVCDGGIDFVCNRKIIGARSYSSKNMDGSARDRDGHGTHVASTIAGNQVIDASYYDVAKGIARGGVPSARLAIYKACDQQVCNGTNVLAAFDHAIADGVDIISVSVNFANSTKLISDPISIGAFHAMERGILTVNSAGNNGPELSSISSHAPWVLTVGASDTDKKIVDKLILGDGSILMGYGINAFPWNGVSLPLVYGKEVTKSCSEAQARNCLVECLENSLIRQSIVLCDHNPNFQLEPAKASGALGWIVPISNKNYSWIMPCSFVRLRKNDLDVVKAFKQSTTKSEAQILKSERIGNLGAPFVASFSSRGPSMHDIIKPDVVAPGVEILAAYSPIGSPSRVPWDKRSVKFTIMSGTSMACPHVAAAAAFVKSFHPEWSPSAIKSALMTTAFELRVSSTLYSETEFAYGSRHIDPLRAIDPGLVYETSVEEYLMIWCNMSRTLGGSANSTCSMSLTPRELNYPSMAAKVQTKRAFEESFPRTLTNVGEGSSTYVASIEGDTSKLNFSVEPNTLRFTRPNEKMNFVVTVRGEK
ncbi:hypothetical protein SSX86_027594 [Deinandra increscens subsp. villosa]|uniref:Uncharacterized protein n=1 Tax=Deinandra increscens subsp. villosa TaxID=3103831 RepID=A0AAP0GK03_9ASTR